MPNSSPITLAQFNDKKAYLAAAPYGVSSNVSFNLAAADVAALMAISTNATLGFNLGASQAASSRTLDIIVLSADNTTGATNSGTKYFLSFGEITGQQAAVLTAEYQNNRDQYTPDTTDGFFMEAANVATMQGLTGYAGIQVTGVREEENGPLNVAMRPVDANGDTIGTVCWNLTRPKPRP